MAAAPPVARSRKVQVLIGCLASIGLVGVGGIVALVLLVLYLGSTPAPIAVADVMGPETSGIVRVEGRLEDPGLNALLERLFDSIESRRSGGPGLPPSLRWLEDMNRANQRQNLRRFAPREAALLLERVDGEVDPRVVVVVSLGVMPRIYEKLLVFLFTGPAGASSVTPSGRTILDLAGEGYVTLVGSSVFWSSSRDALVRVLERVDAGVAAEAPLRERIGVLAEGQDGQLSLQLDGGVPSWLLPNGEAPGACRALEGTLDVVDAETVEGRLVVACDDGSAGEAVRLLEERLAALALPEPLAITFDVTARARDGVATIRVTGVGSALERGFGNP